MRVKAGKIVENEINIFGPLLYTLTDVLSGEKDRKSCRKSVKRIGHKRPFSATTNASSTKDDLEVTEGGDGVTQFSA